MLKVTFDIPTIQKLYPELNRCFGFTYDDISNELTQVYTKKVFHLTPEEKELANQCKSNDDWGVDAVKFALATTENIVVTVPDSFNPKTIMESYVTKLYNEDFASCALIFMAALLYRDRITEVPISEGEYDDMLYQQYIHEVRPDMLKLYIALNQPKQKKGKDFITDIKITAGGNSPIAINNKDSWFENKLNEYLHQYLGVNSLEEAQEELHFIYGDKKVGSKKINPIQSLYIWGTYQLLQDTHLKSVKEKVPTRPQANLIESYLRAIELIEADDVDTDANNIRSRLSYFLNRYDTAEALLDYKTFKLSPYNIGGTKLW
ncbi:hypothetical protein [Bacteroides finegoldii]|jgi:hypothetical protein|uniref:hypothetical protein n=1 Tax=Bacteroides finegoldii TaxID=338188 RepID=UPI00189F32EC|nr:hypothetical protein [Bacteroides finegoldii]